MANQKKIENIEDPRNQMIKIHRSPQLKLKGLRSTEQSPVGSVTKSKAPQGKRNFSQPRLYKRKDSQDQSSVGDKPLVYEYESERVKLLEQMALMNEPEHSKKVFVLFDNRGNSPVMQDLRSEGFINSSDSSYIQAYAIECLIDLCEREHLNKFEDNMKNQN